MMICPCCSKKTYVECCKPLHDGGMPQNALALMRSRYSAYALNLPYYILQTTHPSRLGEISIKQIEDFSKKTEFKKLEILSFKEKGDTAVVTFKAHIWQGGENATFTEKSYFEKFNGKWFYSQPLCD
jgi:SEC-C motif-containing protein